MLVTVLIILSLLTLLSVAQFFRAITNQQESGTSVKSMQASYYAETAISYMEWAWANDADFDSYANIVPSGGDPTTTGDRSEWLSNPLTPGPTTTTGTDGMVMYWDNSPVSGRAVCWPTSACNGGNKPTMYQISVSLPRYIKLDIDQSTGAITPSIPAVPHGNPPVVGTDVPKNGAIVWLTAGTEDEDYEVKNIPCDSTATEQGCFKPSSGGGDTLYNVIAYAIGYVDGRPLHLMRAIVW